MRDWTDGSCKVNRSKLGGECGKKEKADSGSTPMLPRPRSTRTNVDELVNENETDGARRTRSLSSSFKKRKRSDNEQRASDDEEDEFGRMVRKGPSNRSSQSRGIEGPSTIREMSIRLNPTLKSQTLFSYPPSALSRSDPTTGQSGPFGATVPDEFARGSLQAKEGNLSVFEVMPTWQIADPGGLVGRDGGGRGWTAVGERLVEGPVEKIG